ncbi:hypothetical protein ANN_25956 [Periplaneta americana]|uniref:Uncharacterized protein n=1 Tax=Periplaneta americana TaxID=6978 RepID=A0ABQ8S548_PERAM|nr:hypothetical protein ANN_25956 [Periplaneta americana]
MFKSRAVAFRSKASCLGLALRNVRWFESSWEKKFSHEISASIWDRCPPSIVMHLGSYDRFKMRMARETTMWDPYIGRRTQGRPRRRWADTFKQQLGGNWSNIARNRNEWRQIVNKLI